MILENNIDGEYVYITIPKDYVYVYKQILFKLADYGEEMLKDCKATCSDRNKSILDCFNMFNAAIAAYNTDQIKLANLIIKYVMAVLNIDNTIVSETYSDIEINLEYPKASCDGNLLTPTYSFIQNKIITYADGYEELIPVTNLDEALIDWDSNIPGFSYQTGKVPIPISDNPEEHIVGYSELSITLNGITSTKKVNIIQEAYTNIHWYAGAGPFNLEKFDLVTVDTFLRYSNGYSKETKEVTKTKESDYVFFVLIPNYVIPDEFIYKGYDGTLVTYPLYAILNEESWNTLNHDMIEIDGRKYTVKACSDYIENDGEMTFKIR